jgi:transposase-like protein
LHAFIHAGAGFLPPDESSSVDERVASIQQTWRWFWRHVGADGLLIAMVLMKVLMKLLITKVLMSNPGHTKRPSLRLVDAI